LFVSHVRTLLESPTGGCMIPARSDAIGHTFIHESGYGEKMTITKVEVERFSLTCSKPFDAVVATALSVILMRLRIMFVVEFEHRDRRPNR
jgi:hypothetical protein